MRMTNMYCGSKKEISLISFLEKVPSYTVICNQYSGVWGGSWHGHSVPFGWSQEDSCGTLLLLKAAMTLDAFSSSAFMILIFLSALTADA